MLSTLTTLMVSLGAPVYYCLPGLAVLLLLKENERLWLAPLLGYLILGWLAEWSLVFHISPSSLAAAALLISAAVVRSKRAALRKHQPLARHAYLVYLVALSAILLNPYPGLGHWSGDWLENFSMGEAIRLGAYPLELVQRSPLFAAAATPLHWSTTGLAAYQIASAVAAASAALALPYAYRALTQAAIPWTWIFAWLLSPFFLMHIVTIWPKWLAGGCLLVCAVELVRYRRSQSLSDVAWASFWFAGAVAAHISSIILIPILACIAWYHPAFTWRALVRDLGLLLFFGILIPGLFDGWSIAVFGLKERLAHNPTVLYRGGPDFTRITFISTFIGYDFFQLIEEVWNNAALGSGLISVLAKGFYTVSFFLHLMAGTLTGLLIPVCLAARAGIKKLSSLRKLKLFWPVLVCSLIGLLIHASLVVQVPYAGATQIGMTGFCLFLICLLGFPLGVKDSDPVSKRLLAINLGLGTVPFIAMQGAVLTALQLPARISEPLRLMLAKEDADGRIVYEMGLRPIGALLFPGAFVAALFLVGLGVYFLRRKPGVGQK